ncbi:MAG: hypothetical protein SH850_29020 [Planctomycetaceae bacterium]|nr:hypothetical protein [Planctomycetaceae bacterium]
MSLLHGIGNLLRELMGQIPLGAVRVMFVAIPLVLMVWVLRLPASQTTPPDSRPRWNTDLRLWAWVALGAQVLIYCVF